VTSSRMRVEPRRARPPICKLTVKGFLSAHYRSGRLSVWPPREASQVSKESLTLFVAEIFNFIQGALGRCERRTITLVVWVFFHTAA
jgi:hypothetical protein